MQKKKQATHIMMETTALAYCTFWVVKLSNMEQILEPSTKAILCFDFSIAGHLQVAAENFFIVDQWSYSVFFVYNCDQVYQFSMKFLCVGCFFI